MLSSGPAYWAWINGLLPDAVFELVYAPIFAWSDHLGIWRFVSWYYDLFEA